MNAAVYLVMPHENWPIDLASVRVWHTEKLAKLDSGSGRTYKKFTVENRLVCSECGKPLDP